MEKLQTENLKCKNCGASDFDKVNGLLICRYCYSAFIPDKVVVDQKSIDKAAQNKAKVRKGRRILLGVGLLVVALIALVVYLSPHSTTEQDLASAHKYGMAHISEVKGWSRAYYDSIEVATANYKKDGITATYSGGTLYADVVAKVGKPAYVDSSKDKHFTVKAATFTNKKRDKHGRSVFITIQYDTKTGRVTEKEVDSV